MAFNESDFRSKVDRVLQRARTVLENELRPQYAADVPHSYVRGRLWGCVAWGGRS